MSADLNLVGFHQWPELIDLFLSLYFTWIFCQITLLSFSEKSPSHNEGINLMC